MSVPQVVAAWTSTTTSPAGSATSSTRRSSGPWGWRLSRDDDELQGLARALQLQCVSGFVQRHAVSDQRVWVEQAVSEQVERGAHVARAGRVAGGHGQLAQEQVSAVKRR